MSNLLTALLSFTVIVPVILGTILFKRLPGYGQYLVLFMYVCLLTEIASIVVARLYGNNMIVLYFFVSISAIFLGLAYSKLLEKNFLIISLLVPLAAFVESFISGTHTFNSYSFTIFNGFVICLTLYTYYKMILLKIGGETYFFNGFLLFYAFSSSTFFFTGRFLQQRDISLMIKLFDIHSYVNSITNLLFAYSLWTLFKSYSSAR